MKIPEPLTQGASWVLTPIALAFIQQSIVIMIPWLIATLAVIIADLASGIRKSHLLGVHVSPSTAIRETIGKIIVYFSFILAVAMIDVAAEGGMAIAKWCCLFIMGVEGCSVLSNILKPSGVQVSLKGVLKLLLKRSPLGIGDEEADEIIKTARREDRKWNRRKYRKFKEDEDSLYAFDGQPIAKDVEAVQEHRTDLNHDNF